MEEPPVESLSNPKDSVEEEISILLKKPTRGANEPRWEDGLSTGFECLNLACSGRIDVGFLQDFYYVWTGESGSGKSFITMAALAEASINPKYNDHQLILDAPERGILMNIQKFYGKKLAKRLAPPSGTRENPEYSYTLEGFYHNFFTAISKGPCVYLLDSMDPLPTETEYREFLKKGKKLDKVKYGDLPAEESGSYGTDRARVNSKNLRIVYNTLHNSKSILIVIFQGREDIGSRSLTKQMTRGGGTAPTFYAGLELFSEQAGKITTKYKEKAVEQGVRCKVRVKKGRITGKDRTVRIPIYHSAGIDNIGGMCDFLTEWKHWGKSGEEWEMSGKVDATDFGVNIGREKLIKHIYEKNLEDKLREIVQMVWNQIEEKVSVVRKCPYD
jgi:hypothetical protein